MSEERVNMRQALQMLDEARATIRRLDGVRVNIEGAKSKDINTAKANASRELLYAAHLADLARAAVLNEYHRFKGEDPPSITR